MLNFKHLQTSLISLVTILQHCRYAQAEGTEMPILMHVVRLGITQIQGNSDRCEPLFLDFVTVWLMIVLSHSLRILYMPPVYAIISFLSYRFFRSYTYYSFIEVGTFVCFNHTRKLIC